MSAIWTGVSKGVHTDLGEKALADVGDLLDGVLQPCAVLGLPGSPIELGAPQDLFAPQPRLARQHLKTHAASPVRSVLLREPAPNLVEEPLSFFRGENRFPVLLEDAPERTLGR